MFEIFLIIVGIIALIIWLAAKKRKPESYKDLELKLKEEFYEKEKRLIARYSEEIQDIKLQHKQDLADLEKEYAQLERGHRQDAVKRSRNTLMGKLWETVAPYLPKFKYNPSDMRFIGSPIDYIIFKGMNKKDIDSVIFLEIKSGDSKLNEQEEKLKRAIQAKRVKWDEFRIK